MKYSHKEHVKIGLDLLNIMFHENLYSHTNCSCFLYGNKTKPTYRIDTDMEGEVTYLASVVSSLNDTCQIK